MFREEEHTIMSDLYKEHLVKKERSTSDLLVRIGLIGGTGLLAAAGLLITPLLLLPAVVMGVVTYFLLPGTDLEYEYLLVNHSLDIDKVMAKTKRKKCRSFDLAQADIIAPLHSHRLDYYNANTSIKVLDFSSGNDEHLRYAFIINDSGSNTKVIIEPDEAMISMLRSSMPGKCFTD